MREFILRTAKEHLSKAQAKLMGYVSSGQSDQFVDATAHLSDDQTKVTTGDGKEYKAIISGTPTKYDAAIRLSEDTFLVQHQVIKSMFTGGGQIPWLVIGTYPPGALISSPVSAFPQFNLLNGDTLKKYRIPHSLLATVFNTTPEPSDFLTDNGFNGVFHVTISPDISTLVIVRSKIFNTNIQTIGPVALGGGNFHNVSTVDIKVHWGVIKNFVLNDDDGTIEIGDNTDITQGTQRYNYNMQVVNQGDLFSNGMPIGSDGAYGFGDNNNTANTLSSTPVVWFDEAGDAKIDLFGAWSSGCISGWILNANVPGFYFGSGDRDSVMVGGLFKVENVQSGGGLASQNFGGIRHGRQRSIGSNYIYTGVGIVQSDQYGSGLSGLSPHGDIPHTILPGETDGTRILAYRSADGIGVGAYRRQADQQTPGYDVEETLRLSPYLNIVDTIVPAEGNMAATYIGDESRFYNASNATTAWISKYNTNGSPDLNLGTVKVVGTGEFLELRLIAAGAGKRLEKLKQWVYDSDTNTIVEGEDITALEEDPPVPLTVLGPGAAVYTTFTVMDYAVQ